MPKESPSQTAGPYVHIGCTPSVAGLTDMFGGDLGAVMVQDQTAITLDLTVYDGDGAPLTDAMIEIWQAGPDGAFGTTPGFTNWGRQAADLTTGRARFHSLMPGAMPGQAPHVLVWIVARGINLGLTTRVYFAPSRDDPVLALAAERAATLIAQPTETGFTHAIYLQGPYETVFFDV